MIAQIVPYLVTSTKRFTIHPFDICMFYLLYALRYCQAYTDPTHQHVAYLMSVPHFPVRYALRASQQ